MSLQIVITTEAHRGYFVFSLYQPAGRYNDFVFFIFLRCVVTATLFLVISTLFSRFSTLFSRYIKFVLFFCFLVISASFFFHFFPIFSTSFSRYINLVFFICSFSHYINCVFSLYQHLFLFMSTLFHWL